MSERKRGRPPLAENQRSAAVLVKMEPKLYDHAYDLASKQRTTIPDVMRELLRRTQRNTPDR